MTPKKSDIILGEEGVKNRRKSSDIIYVRSLTKIYFTQRAEAGCYYKKKIRQKTLHIQKIQHKISLFISDISSSHIEAHKQEKT